MLTRQGKLRDRGSRGIIVADDPKCVAISVNSKARPAAASIAIAPSTRDPRGYFADFNRDDQVPRFFFPPPFFGGSQLSF